MNTMKSVGETAKSYRDNIMAYSKLPRKFSQVNNRSIKVSFSGLRPERSVKRSDNG